VPELTVEENICLPLWVSPRLNVRERLRFVYGILPELLEMRERKALLLSGGQQKLVALARALAVGTRCCCWTSLRGRRAGAVAAPVGSGRPAARLGLAVLISQSDLNHSRHCWTRSRDRTAAPMVARERWLERTRLAPVPLRTSSISATRACAASPRPPHCPRCSRRSEARRIPRRSAGAMATGAGAGPLREQSARVPSACARAASRTATAGAARAQPAEFVHRRPRRAAARRRAGAGQHARAGPGVRSS
jgi:hypothetical protein